MIQSVKDAILAPPAYDAWEKWRYYVAACKKEPKNKTYQKLKKIYNEVKNGAKVIDLRKAIVAGGQHANMLPRIAVIRASVKVCKCFLDEQGNLSYDSSVPTWGEYRMQFSKAFPSFGTGRYGWGREGTALVPPIPSEHQYKLKGYRRGEYYVLWEVAKWENVLPADPYLLRRLTEEMYVIEAEWDLTEIERIIMQQTMY